MKITIDEHDKNKDIEVVIKGSKDDERVQKLYQTLLYYDQSIIGKKDDRHVQLPLNIIYYFDTIDDLTFAYTKNHVYEVNYRLYQLEEMFQENPFLRVNKHTIVNIKKIKYFHSTMNGRMEAKLLNDERIKISRRYVPDLKKKLGGVR
jgi:DNA-binding LytR/AlgR family response regulator